MATNTPDVSVKQTSRVFGDRVGFYGPAGGDRAPTFAAEKGTGRYLGEYRRQ